MKRITALFLTAILIFIALPALATSTDSSNAAFLASYSSDELLQMWTQIGALLHTNGTYPFTELAKGDTGYEVKALQTQLSALGYYQKEIVDNFGNGTYNALREFEKASGLKADGIASAEDQMMLYIAAEAAAGTTLTDIEQNNTDMLGAYAPDELLQLWYEIGSMLRANGTYPYEELQNGDIGYEVTTLQTRLQELGYYHKTIVENFGSGTYSAMRDFESQNGLQVNGIASAADQQMLFSSDAAVYTQQSTTNSTNNNNDATTSATP